MSLREGGIYRLPNGRELVVLQKHENGRVSHRLRGWEHFETAEYEVNETERLVYQGKLTAWEIADLRDTGRTAPELAHPFDKGSSWSAARQ